MEFCDIKKKDDVTKVLKPASIRKSNESLEALILIITECTNPFSPELSKDHLYNISNGKSVSNDIHEFLSSVETMGDKQRRAFISECVDAPDRFDKSIKKNNIINFDSRNKVIVKIFGKVKEMQIQRDIFGRLLSASVKKKIDIEKTLCFPLTPIPFSLCHNDGSICKTPKSILLKELELLQNAVTGDSSGDVHIYVPGK